MLDGALLDWANKQPRWVVEALRRQAARPDRTLTEAEKAEVIGNIRHAALLGPGGGPERQTLRIADLTGGGDQGHRTLLCSLGPVRNVNRLAADQQMSFATNGLTIVYGDNGSGKSGYCRIAKKLCRSLTEDDLLGDVFEDRPAAPARVLVRYLSEGALRPTAVEWVDGEVPPEAISKISVFDAQNARLYVDGKNRIGFLPAEIALLEAHGTLRRELDSIFRRDLSEIDRRMRSPIPKGYSTGGDVSTLLARLDPKAKNPVFQEKEITNLASLSDGELAELDALEASLASDPSTMAGQRRRATVALKKYASIAKEIDIALSEDAVNELRAIHERVVVTAEAAALTAADQFADMPLPGVGLSSWRLMYDYARKYAADIGVGNGNLPDQDSERCVLCQKPLSSEGAARIREFNSFVASEASKAADAAAEARDNAIRSLTNFEIPSGAAVTVTLDEYSNLSRTRGEFASKISAYFEAAYRRRAALCSAGDVSAFEAVPHMPTSIVSDLVNEYELLLHEAQMYQRAADGDATSAAERLRRDKLRDRKKLNDDLPIVLERFRDLSERRQIEVCIQMVDTGVVSRQITALRRDLVMDKLEARIAEEIEFLDLLHIPFSVNDKSQGGQSYFEVGLGTSKPIATSRVLSEGEQQALALACFLAEVGGDTACHGMIIDDPVSSLDHIRIRRVAGRLVREAAEGRQVIIFTHNLLFFNELIEAASRANPPVPVVRNFIRKSESEGFGLVTKSESPWIARTVTQRVEELRRRLAKLAGADRSDHELWRKAVNDFYSDLRESWERLVEEILLGKVVERFCGDVRTQSLRGVVVDDDDHKKIYWAMKRVSERSGHDMAAFRAIPLPSLQEMQDDLNVLDAYRDMINKRKKITDERRRSVEKPPVGEVL